MPVYRAVRVSAFILILFSLGPSLWPSVYAWGGDTHVWILIRSCGFLPQPWSDVWLEYYDALRLGALAPDQVFRDFYNHVYHPDSGYGGAPWAVERWFGYVVGNLSSGDYGAAVFSAGVLSHYVADVANPLHTGSSGAEEAIHSNYESEVSRRLLRLDIGAVEPRNVTGIAAYVASIAKASHGYYWPLINNYTRYGWNIHVERMTEECLSLAVEATTSLWITAISAASPSPPGSPPQSPISNTSTGSDGGRGHVVINEVGLIDSEAEGVRDTEDPLGWFWGCRLVSYVYDEPALFFVLGVLGILTV
ncbi:MAG: zinc dependent phospholipase C family protein [Candidatus Bathyarchaeia archaeon]